MLYKVKHLFYSDTSGYDNRKEIYNTNIKDNRSEVTRLKQQIELEYTSGKRAMTGFSEGASHEAITRRMEGMWEATVRLEQIAGKEVTKQFLERL
jgi:hypothetical protein